MKKPAHNPKSYWNALVTGTGSLANVGHKSLGAYNWWAYRFRLRALKEAIRRVDLPRSRVFEAAYGEGFYLGFWRGQATGQVDGMDISSQAWEAARERYPEYGLRCGDLTDIGGFEGLTKYDLVTAIDVLYHVCDDEAWAVALANLLSLVDEEGVFVASDKFPSTGTYQRFPHVRRRSLEMWREQLEANGFQISGIVPVFLLMDDPIICGVHPGLGRLALFQWWILTEAIKGLKRLRILQAALATAVALIQYLPEKLSLSLLSRTPNLELIVCERVGDKGLQRSPV